MEQLTFDFFNPPTAKPIHPERLVPLLTDEQFETVYGQYVRGELVTSLAMEPKDFGKRFKSIEYGYFRDWEPHELDEIGMVYNHISERIPAKNNRDIDMPCFMTFKALHRSDLVKMLARLNGAVVDAACNCEKEAQADEPAP